MVAIVLAAGKSKRMKSKIPKLLFPILGHPLVNYPIDAAREAGIKKIIVVIAPKSKIPEAITNVNFVCQKKALGTGDAVKAALRKVKKTDSVLILNGDIPLITASTIKKMLRRIKSRKSDGILMSAVIDDPTGYGRIIRGRNGRVLNIVEEKNLDEEQRSIKEINVGVYIFKFKPLKAALKKLKLDQRKKEYLLTDVIDIMNEQKRKILAFKGDYLEALGINTKEQYLEVRKIMKRRFINDFIKKGVIIEDAATVEIEPGVKIAPGVKISSYTRIKRGSKIGRETFIGPFTWIGKIEG